MVHNLTWSGVYPRSDLSNTLLQKVLTLAPLKATGPGVFVFTMTTFLSISYYDLEDTFNHMNSLKIKSYPGDNVAYLCTGILVDYDHL